MQSLDFENQRQRLIECELRKEGIQDERVLRAMREVPREEFVAEEMRKFAYRNSPLPIESGQTISQPLIVAMMAEALGIAPGERVLEVGTGSGYAAAVLSRIAKDVYTIERLGGLARTAAIRLKRLGYDNVRVIKADGTRGWPEEGPFDAIVVTAGGPKVPPALLEQLRIGGRLVIPVGKGPHEQNLIRVVRLGEDKYKSTDLGKVRFVPLIGHAGWQLESAVDAKVTRSVSEGELQ